MQASHQSLRQRLSALEAQLQAFTPLSPELNPPTVLLSDSSDSTETDMSSDPPAPPSPSRREIYIAASEDLLSFNQPGSPTLLATLEEISLIHAVLDTITYPVLSLPNELLALIFEMSLPSYLSRMSHMPYSFPLALTHVCSRWRAIAHSVPALWRHIYFDPSSYTPWLPTWLTFAKGCLTSLVLNLPRRHHLSTEQHTLLTFNQYWGTLSHLELYSLTAAQCLTILGAAPLVTVFLASLLRPHPVQNTDTIIHPSLRELSLTTVQDLPTAQDLLHGLAPNFLTSFTFATPDTAQFYLPAFVLFVTRIPRIHTLHLKLYTRRGPSLLALLRSLPSLTTLCVSSPSAGLFWDILVHLSDQLDESVPIFLPSLQDLILCAHQGLWQPPYATDILDLLQARSLARPGVAQLHKLHVTLSDGPDTEEANSLTAALRLFTHLDITIRPLPDL
ncbi:hypothetical protein C8R45DRAFT_1129617 [Mycena sanguinolenta]|nr:hypothetical protein C8R45DRAFT_1129617 [Mycena sanguinolenta]